MSDERTGLMLNQELRAAARKQLQGNWGKAVLVALLYSVIAFLLGIIPYLGPLINFVISGALVLGLYAFYVELVRGNSPHIEKMFDGFKNFVRAFVLQFLVALFTLLWSLLLIVPGIIAAYRYSQAFLILNDNPDMSAMDAIRKSKEMMKGRKGKLFLLQLSFIGWALLCVITVGIGFLWLTPYMLTAQVNFYEDIKNAGTVEENKDDNNPAIEAP